MTEPTKACNLSENEIKQLIIWHGYNLNDEGKSGLSIDGDMADRIDRINYLNKRLKEFKKADAPAGNNEAAQAVASTANASGWGT